MIVSPTGNPSTGSCGAGGCLSRDTWHEVCQLIDILPSNLVAHATSHTAPYREEARLWTNIHYGRNPFGIIGLFERGDKYCGGDELMT